MVQIIDLQNHELLTEISAKQSATVSGGANNSGAAGLTNITSFITLFLFLSLFSNLGFLNNSTPAGAS